MNIEMFMFVCKQILWPWIRERALKVRAERLKKQKALEDETNMLMALLNDDDKMFNHYFLECYPNSTSTST